MRFYCTKCDVRIALIDSYACSFLFTKDKIQRDSDDKVTDYYRGPRGWRESPHGKNDCNKENSGAASNLYIRTPQRVRTRVTKL